MVALSRLCSWFVINALRLQAAMSRESSATWSLQIGFAARGLWPDGIPCTSPRGAGGWAKCLEFRRGSFARASRFCGQVIKYLLLA